MNNLRYITYVVGAIIGLAVLSSFFGSFYTIDQGERGVLLTNGALSGVAEPGLGYKLPFIQTVREISIQSHTSQFTTEAYSKDQQPGNISLSINYHVPPDQVDELYAQYGTVDNLIHRLVERKLLDEFKTVFGTFKAVDAIANRGQLNLAVLTALKEGIIGPVAIESIQIEDISFTDAYEAGIEAKQLAEVKVAEIELKSRQAIEAAKITVTEAQAQADATLAGATARAKAVELAGAAEATAIRAKGAALRDNPQLVGLVQAERWDGKLPSQMIPGGTVPFLNVNPQ
jgi:regulator of protease activity HflC (stomatin/prohibitin superfamily)